MSPDLPLERRHHEMIATMVSVTNGCVQRASTIGGSCRSR
jgi:hypothetical protein